MSFADQNGNYQISRTEYPRFINSLSAFGSDLSFENLPFVLKESFEHLQKGGQLQQVDAQEICDKTRTAIQLATLLSGLA